MNEEYIDLVNFSTSKVELDGYFCRLKNACGNVTKEELLFELATSHANIVMLAKQYKSNKKEIIKLRKELEGKDQINSNLIFQIEEYKKILKKK
jgi:hypothetical protein